MSRGDRERAESGNRGADKTYPWSRKHYYFTQTLFVGYAVLWLVGWYFVAKNGSGFGMILQILLFLVFLFTQPTGVPFEPYDKAMKKMMKWRPPPSNGHDPRADAATPDGPASTAPNDPRS